jgi:hypothetical protein
MVHSDLMVHPDLQDLQDLQENQDKKVLKEARVPMEPPATTVHVDRREMMATTETQDHEEYLDLRDHQEN